MDYRPYLKFYPNFPKKGVNFVDIIPLIQDKELFRQLVDDLIELCDTDDGSQRGHRRGPWLPLCHAHALCPESGECDYPA